MAFASCVKNAKPEFVTTPKSESAKTITNTDRNLKQDLYAMVRLNKQIAAQLLQSGVSKQDLLDAVQSGSDAKLRSKSKIAPGEYQRLLNSFNEMREGILRKYPEVQRLVEKNNSYITCNTEKKLAAINSLPTQVVNGIEIISPTALSTSQDESVEPPSDTVGGTECDWVPYTACLVVCAGTGPWLYWPCAYLCVRSWCK